MSDSKAPSTLLSSIFMQVALKFLIGSAPFLFVWAGWASKSIIDNNRDIAVVNTKIDVIEKNRTSSEEKAQESIEKINRIPVLEERMQAQHTAMQTNISGINSALDDIKEELREQRHAAPPPHNHDP